MLSASNSASAIILSLFCLARTQASFSIINHFSLAERIICSFSFSASSFLIIISFSVFSNSITFFLLSSIAITILSQRNFLKIRKRIEKLIICAMIIHIFKSSIL
jgi:hypothetical protein